jgi:AcrR family transcriptional regulator
MIGNVVSTKAKPAVPGRAFGTSIDASIADVVVAPARVSVAPVTTLPKRRQATHQRIVAAACSLFSRRGVANVSVEDILLEADISRGTFYKYFSNKEDVLKAIVLPVFEFLIERFSRLGNVDAATVLEEVLRSYFQQWQNAPEALVLAFNIGQANFSLVQPQHDAYVQLLAGLISRIQQQGILRLDDQLATSLLIARTVVPVLQSLQKTAAFEQNFLVAMKGMLLRNG